MAVGDTNFIQALGAGGNVDTTRLVSDLVAAARAPEQSRIDAERKKNEVSITSLSALRAGLSGLLDGVTQLSDRNRLNKLLVSSSVPSKLLGEPTIYGGTTAATHSIQATQLAQAQRVASVGYATTTQQLNSGAAFTLNFLVGTPDVTIPLTIDAEDGEAGDAEVQNFTPSTFGSNKEYTLTIGGTTLTATDPTNISDLVSKLQADADYDSGTYTISEGTGSNAGNLVITWITNGDQPASTLSLSDTSAITTSLTNVATDGDVGTAEQQLFTPTSFGSDKEYTLTIGGTTLTATDPTDISDLVSKLQADADYDSGTYTISEGTGSNAGNLVITWITNGDQPASTLSLSDTSAITTSLTNAATDGDVGTVEQQLFTPTSFGSDKEYTLTIGGTTLTATDPTDISDLVSKLQADPNYDSSTYTISEGTGISAGRLVITWIDSGDRPDATLSFTVEGDAVTKTVSIQAGSDTPSGIVSAINSAKIGIKARIVSDGSGTTPYRIILEGKPGEKNQYSMSGAPAALGFDFDSPLQNARDSIFLLDGMTMRRESNTVNDAITGVSFTMTSTSSESITLDVRKDTAGVRAAVQGFIDAYNSYAELHARLSGKPVKNDDYAGSLSNDSVLNGIFREIRGLVVKISSTPTAAIRTWADIGVSLDRFGKMSLDDDSFNEALSSYPEEIQTALTGDRPIASTAEDNAGGLSGDLYSRLYNLLKGSGRFSNVESSRSVVSNRLDERQEKLDSRIAAINDRYLAQFSAMDAALQQYKSLGSSMNSILGMNRKSND